MESEFQIKYQNLLVHHLEKEEVEFELDIRSVQFEKEETLSVLRRRLREKLKREKGAPEEIDFAVCITRTVDGEINLIDGKIKEINDYLEKKKEFEGVKEALGTRLVHYFARCSAIQGFADDDKDLEDIDKLLGTIRRLYSTYFTIFTPLEAIRQEVMLQITNSLTQLQLGQPESSAQAGSQGTQTEDTEREESLVEMNRQRRELRSTLEKLSPNRNRLNFDKASGSGIGQKNIDRILNRIDLSGKKSANNRRTIGNSSESESSVCLSPPRRSKSRSSRVTNHRSKPVSDWNLRRYDGRDGGQGLMRFVREVEFYAKSEGVSDRELFRSAIHLFAGLAKLWFMQGVENEDFTCWQELVNELKKEFLSPDHDHTCESTAVERRQQSREKFQDFFFDIQKIFNSMTKPISEKKKFEIVNRNLRADYRGHVAAAQIDNLADLKTFGRKLDATFWYKYQSRNQDEQSSRNRGQVNEIKSNPKVKLGNERDHSIKDRSEARSLYKAGKDKEDRKSDRGGPPAEETNGRNGESDGLKVLLDKYVPPKPGRCYNCRLLGHHHSECDRPKHKFCLKCGFHNVETKLCPFCAKNA